MCIMVSVPKVPFTLWMLFISMVYSQNTDSALRPNVTTLYPVTNQPIRKNETDNKLLKPTAETFKKSPQSWKIAAAFTESNITEVEENNSKDLTEEKELTNFDEDKELTDFKEEKESTDFKEEKELTDFKEEKVTAAPKEDAKKVEVKEIFKDFKPSQHLGSFFDDDSAEVINTPIATPVFKKTPSAFVSSSKDVYPPSFNRIPQEIYQTHQEFPYKFEEAIFTKTKGWSDSTRTKYSEDWPESIESKPTVEVPVKVPAGGFYKSPEAFKETPLIDEEYGLEVNDDGKEHRIKKRVNPWQNLLRLVTAFIPVGLIISALTPSVITIHNVDEPQSTNLPYRRSDSGAQNLSPISERCRRRLLCELQSERNYAPSSSPRRKNHCYKIHCEDTEALWKMLRWLFTYNQATTTHHQEPDDRGRHLT